MRRVVDGVTDYSHKYFTSLFSLDPHLFRSEALFTHVGAHFPQIDLLDFICLD